MNLRAKPRAQPLNLERWLAGGLRVGGEVDVHGRLPTICLRAIMRRPIAHSKPTMPAGIRLELAGLLMRRAQALDMELLPPLIRSSSAPPAPRALSAPSAR